MLTEVYHISINENKTIITINTDQDDFITDDYNRISDGSRVYYRSQKLHSLIRPSYITYYIDNEISEGWYYEDMSIQDEVDEIFNNNLIDRNWRAWTEEERCLFQILIMDKI